MGEHQVEEDDQDAAINHGFRAGLADLQRSAFGFIAEKAGNGGNDKGEHDGFDKGIIDCKSVEIDPKSGDIIMARDKIRHDHGEPPTKDAHPHADDDQDRVDDQGQDQGWSERSEEIKLLKSLEKVFLYSHVWNNSRNNNKDYFHI